MNEKSIVINHRKLMFLDLKSGDLVINKQNGRSYFCLKTEEVDSSIHITWLDNENIILGINDKQTKLEGWIGWEVMRL